METSSNILCKQIDSIILSDEVQDNTFQKTKIWYNKRAFILEKRNGELV